MIWIERFLTFFADCWFRFVPRRQPGRDALLDCKIIAHRGQHDNRQVRENTLAAFRQAAAAGCWGLEMDLRWTRDLYPVVLHDPDLARVFDIELDVASVDLAELRERVPEVPTLAEVVAEFGGRYHLMVEIKGDDIGEYGLRGERLEQAFAPLVPARDYHLLALDAGLFELAGYCPAKACLPVAQWAVGRFSREALARGYAGICAQYLLIGSARIRQHHQQGQKIGIGFAASRNSLFREINRGVDWVFTNHACQLAELRRDLLGDDRPA